MIRWLRRFAARLAGTDAVPGDFSGTLTSDERVLAVARDARGPLVATHLGLWLPEESGARRLGWHLISKASWDNGTLDLIEAEEIGEAGTAVLLRDRPRARFTLTEPGRLPEVVHARVTGSIKSRHHRDLPCGGAWFVQRKVPGRDGVVLQIRGDAGADEQALARFAEDVAARLPRSAEAGLD